MLALSGSPWLSIHNTYVAGDGSTLTADLNFGGSVSVGYSVGKEFGDDDVVVRFPSFLPT